MHRWSIVKIRLEENAKYIFNWYNKFTCDLYIHLYWFIFAYILNSFICLVWGQSRNKEIITAFYYGDFPKILNVFCTLQFSITFINFSHISPRFIEFLLHFPIDIFIFWLDFLAIDCIYGPNRRINRNMSINRKSTPTTKYRNTVKISIYWWKIYWQWCLNLQIKSTAVI